MLKVAIVPAFQDNYLWVIHNETDAAVVDPGDAAPIIAYLTKHKLNLLCVLTTHHHADHIGGVDALLDYYHGTGKIPVFGPARDNIPTRTHALGEGDLVSLGSLDLELHVLDVPGHTAGHIAYHAPANEWLFCGDTLFACGCGRLFEGTTEQMQASLAKLKALPGKTKVYCAHEYTMANIKFALAVEPDNAALKKRAAKDGARREKNTPTVPFTIADEIATNPFLRWDSPAVIAAAKTENPAPALVFGAIREWKNNFK